MPELPEVETTVRAINQFENSFLKKIVIKSNVRSNKIPNINFIK